MTTAERPAQTIMVVEDNAIAREGLSVILRRHGYNVLGFENGLDALTHLGTGAPPDLILLDMLMPVLDGWHFLQRLRESPQGSVPIVVTTGTILTREWAAQNGCAGFLKKPIEEDEVVDEINRILAAPD
jgi:two-component system, chemotaxis family, chemotaxis protein CheY